MIFILFKGATAELSSNNQSSNNANSAPLEQESVELNSHINQPILYPYVNHNFLEDELKNFVLINSLKVKHNFAFTEIQSICKLLNLKSESADINFTKYKTNKIIDTFCNNLSIHHVCNACQGYIGAQSERLSDKIEEILHCKSCNIDVDVQTNYDDGNFFLYISLGFSVGEHFFEIW